MGKAPEPELACATLGAWQRWLTKHHASSMGIWLRIPKGKPECTLTYPSALDSALAWGWIDSQKRALDETAWLQRFTPRTAKSPWSKINCTKAEALVAAGSMQPAGLREVERAKADGRWARAYDGARTSEVPADLSAALDATKGARTFFDALRGANRYAILHRVQTASNATTRAARIVRLVAMCARGETIH